MTFPGPVPGRHLSAETGPQSIVDQVTESILAMILDGELPPGKEVAIKSLSARINVSHVPVREALRRLESRGLVIFHRGRQPQIAPADVTDFDEIYRLRRTIEVSVASQSAGLFTDARLRALDRYMGAFRASMEGDGSLSSSPSVHSQLHLALLPAASRWDVQLLEQLWDGTERYLQLYLTHERRRPEVTDRIIRVHQKLVDVANNGDPVKLAECVGEHVDNSIRVVRPVIVEITQTGSAAPRPAARP
jgi:DNA-binding GntR family transcriptional regulator